MSTEAMAGGTVALAANWLDQSQSVAMSNAANAGVNFTTTTAWTGGDSCITISNNLAGVTTCYPNWWVYPQTYYYPWYVPSTTYVNVPEKIRLKAGEVERLRKAASRDAKLKAVLNKFTPLIEVVLEF